ncbi:hypothetical protein BC833DRAFT_626368 [Globomyces pollinis-pini]|nr:hypothetical protein BC833DRAFT_626368 [Globomyces pollinis-pini]
MKTSNDHRQSTSNRLIDLPVEIKQIIANYLPMCSLLNYRLCSKDLNYNYQLSQQQLDELYNNKKLFNNAPAFKCYLQFKEPIGADFEYAIDKNLVDVVKVLLEDGRSDPSTNNNYAIQLTSAYGFTDIVRMLLDDQRVVPSSEDNQSIRQASEYGYPDIVKMLLNDERVDPSADDNSAIKLAAEGGHMDTVKVLLQDVRVDPSADDNYAIKYASENGYTEVVILLLNNERFRIDNETINYILDREDNEELHQMLMNKASEMEQSLSR